MKNSEFESESEYALEGDPLYNFADNSKYRGTWDTWLRDCVNAENPNHLLWICRSIHNFTIGAKCITCREHSFKYVKENPPEIYIQSRQDFFKYLVTFMNFVQKRKHRLLYNPEILWTYYTKNDTEPCNGDDCEKHGNNDTPVKRQINITVNGRKITNYPIGVRKL